MPTYIIIDKTGAISAHADWEFPGSVLVDYNVIRGYDGRLYKEGEEPTPPAPTLEDQLAAIEAKYAPKIAALREGIMSAYLTGGAIMDENVSGLRTEWAAVIAQRNAEMETLLI